MNLKPEDADKLIAEFASVDAIIVGGQAIMFWSQYFGIRLSAAALTSDIDFIAKTKEARRAAAKISQPHKLYVPDMDHATPNTAMIEIQLEGYEDPIVIDYLSGVAGISTADIEKRAVTVEYLGKQIKVLHPLDCLRSKFSNLLLLAGKRTIEGIEQARVSIVIANRFIERLIDDRRPHRELTSAAESIREIAESKAGLYAYKEYDLDCLGAVPDDRFSANVFPKEFVETRWPQIVAHIAAKRARTLAKPKKKTAP